MINADKLQDLFSSVSPILGKGQTQFDEDISDEMRGKFETLVNKGQENASEDSLLIQTEEEQERESIEILKEKKKHLECQKDFLHQREINSVCLVQKLMQQDKIEEKLSAFVNGENDPGFIKDEKTNQWINGIQQVDVDEEAVQKREVKQDLQSQKLLDRFTHNSAQSNDPLVVRFDAEVGHSHTMGHSQSLDNLKIGDKLSLKAGKKNFLSPLNDVQITLNKKVGSVQLLHLKLTPGELGTIDAKLRMTTQGLHIELQVQRQETARLLADNQQMLMRILEKVHARDGIRSLVTIVDKSISENQLIQVGQGLGQGYNQQNFDGQRQAFDRNDQGRHNGSKQFFKQFLLEDSLLIEPLHEDAYPRSSHRLFV
ncbi:flagellar hook-length control protein FliK [Bartonella ancashensis]|uniref:Flagellar hook-length control protein-like C-terminal domain-containing protein n=1 Tax=Bartonella ancashensis TaxID=1318743 RepID=A0A0M5KSA6_9HYPH|nr:flagellar hook-length control protein FliK [Bartonella ancashensis]ALE02953.1 hypothetical protein PU02_0139 [Bartonella ancashensis]